MATNAKPHVTAVMVTGKHVDRFPLAMCSLAAFQQQTYPDRDLLIINDNPQNLLPDGFEDPRISEVKIKPPGKTLGELRNMGLALAKGDLVMQWDDDDFSHPERIAWQVSQTKMGKATIFLREIHVKLGSNPLVAFNNCGKISRAGGFAGTVLHTREGEIRYEHERKHEDTTFLLKWIKRGLLTVLDNDPKLYVRLYHGMNTWTEQHVMTRRAGAKSLTSEERTYVEHLMQEHYARFFVAQ